MIKAINNRKASTGKERRGGKKTRPISENAEKAILKPQRGIARRNIERRMKQVVRRNTGKIDIKLDVVWENAAVSDARKLEKLAEMERSLRGGAL